MPIDMVGSMVQALGQGAAPAERSEADTARRLAAGNEAGEAAALAAGDDAGGAAKLAARVEAGRAARLAAEAEVQGIGDGAESGLAALDEQLQAERDRRGD